MALDFARNGETESLAAMVQHGLPANLSDAKGSSLLTLASYHGHAETARLLLTHSAEVDRCNDRGQTPLGGVAFKAYEEIVALLLAHGADIDGDTGRGMTPSCSPRCSTARRWSNNCRRTAPPFVAGIVSAFPPSGWSTFRAG